jgi:hypothetical protein
MLFLLAEGGLTARLLLDIIGRLFVLVDRAGLCGNVVLDIAWYWGIGDTGLGPIITSCYFLLMSPLSLSTDIYRLIPSEPCGCYTTIAV